MVDLSKRTETAQESIVSLMKTSLEKGIDLGEVSAACVLVMDYSGSMEARYLKGEVQDIAEKTLALALAGLDDDGDIQVYFFHDQAFDPIEVNDSNYSGAVDSFRRRNRMGGTNYAPVIKKIIQDVTGTTPGGEAPKRGLFRKQRKVSPSQSGPAEMPTLVFFVTDGAPFDQAETMQLLKDASNLPIFWQFLGVGYSPRFLQQLDTMGGRVVDNVGLTDMTDTTAVTDEEWFKEMLTEFMTSWLPEARKAGIIR